MKKKNLKITFTRGQKIKIFVAGFLITYMNYIVWGLFIAFVIYRGEFC